MQDPISDMIARVKNAQSRGHKEVLLNSSKIKLGICGEHGGDPKSILICHNLGLNYVSASPYRVPVARLAAAQAQIKKIG